MNAQDERDQVLRGRFPRETEQALGPAKYRGNGVIVQVVFFILACICIGAAYLLLHALDVSYRGVITGIAALAVAEFLIRARRWFGTGVEAALWIGGLFAIISDLPSTGAPEAVLVVGAAAALAGARVRNPLFGAIAAGCVIQYAETVRDLGVVCALVIATFAGLALLREWRRQSTEWLWIALVVTAPVIGRFHVDVEWRVMSIVLYGSFGAVMLALGLARRHHALLAAGAIGLAIAAVDIGERIALPLELRLASAGAFLLGGSFVISRVLRERTRGIVVSPAPLTAFDDALESLGAVAAAHSAHSGASSEGASPEARPTGDGGFGGAGASDGY